MPTGPKPPRLSSTPLRNAALALNAFVYETDNPMLSILTVGIYYILGFRLFTNKLKSCGSYDSLKRFRT